MLPDMHTSLMQSIGIPLKVRLKLAWDYRAFLGRGNKQTSTDGPGALRKKIPKSHLSELWQKSN